MFFRCISMILMIVCAIWASCAFYVSDYVLNFYKRRVPKDDLEPVRISLSISLISIAMGMAVNVAIRVAKRRAIELGRGDLMNESRTPNCPTYPLLMGVVSVAGIVMWFFRASETLIASLRMKDSDFKMFTAGAHAISALTSVAYACSLCIFAIPAEEVYYADQPDEEEPADYGDVYGVDQNDPDPQMDDDDSSRQEIKIEEKPEEPLLAI